MSKEHKTLGYPGEQANLGDIVEDQITGLRGVVVCDARWLYGCRRFTVQPMSNKDGKPAETFCIDAQQCRGIEGEVFAPAPSVANPAGPRQDPQRPADPRR